VAPVAFLLRPPSLPTVTVVIQWAGVCWYGKSRLGSMLFSSLKEGGGEGGGREGRREGEREGTG
jgi:hypothetical protein